MYIHGGDFIVDYHESNLGIIKTTCKVGAVRPRRQESFSVSPRPNSQEGQSPLVQILPAASRSLATVRPIVTSLSRKTAAGMEVSVGLVPSWCHPKRHERNAIATGRSVDLSTGRRCVMSISAASLADLEVSLIPAESLPSQLLLPSSS